MKTKWESLLTSFYGVVESVKKFGYGFALVYLFRMPLNHPSFWKSIFLTVLGLIAVWIVGKMLYSLFELSINPWYEKDVSNYRESGIVLNSKTKKVEGVNHFITVSERYSNSEYQKYLLKTFGFIHLIMFFVGTSMGYLAPIIQA